MNCQQGDVAIVVRSKAGNEGKIVTCLRFVGQIPGQKPGYTDWWEVDTLLNQVNMYTLQPMKPAAFARDSLLKPFPKLREKSSERLTKKEPA